MPKVMLYFATVFLLIAVDAQPLRVDPVVIGTSGGSGSCPSDDLLQSARRNLSDAVLLALPITPCGDSGWTQVTSLDMSDPSQQCPPPWTLYGNPTRSCSVDSAGCQGINLTVGILECVVEPLDMVSALLMGSKILRY